MLRSDSRDFSDAYIVVTGKINVAKPNNNAYDKKLAFKNNAAFVSCISKFNNRLIDNVEKLDIVMPLYNLIEYSKNYSKTTGRLWNYYRDEPNSGLGGVGNNINYWIKHSKSFDDKTSLTGKWEGSNTEKKAELVVPLRYLSNFWRVLDMPLINCEINLILTWSEIFVITNKEYKKANAETAVVRIDNLANATFQIKDTKLYVPVVTLSTKDDNDFSEQLIKRTIKWNEYRSEMTNKTKTNNLNDLIDPAFNKVNRLFVLLFDNEERRICFSKYYVPKVEVKDFNLLIDGKMFFDVSVKKKEEANEKFISINKNNDYTTG